MIKYFVAFSLFALLGFFITVAIYLGVFKEVEISEKALPPTALVYKMHIGPYHKINSAIMEVEKWAKENNITCLQTFGEYLSDPEEVDEANLRSHAGCVVEKEIENLPNKWASRTVQFFKSIEAVFKGSPAVGPFKVYPKVDEYAKEKKLELLSFVFEFYEVHESDMRTRYIFPIKVNYFE